jgi:Ca2+/Na+ antiporter
MYGNIGIGQFRVYFSFHGSLYIWNWTVIVVFSSFFFLCYSVWTKKLYNQHINHKASIRREIQLSSTTTTKSRKAQQILFFTFFRFVSFRLIENFQIEISRYFLIFIYFIVKRSRGHSTGIYKCEGNYFLLHMRRVKEITPQKNHRIMFSILHIWIRGEIHHI